MKGLILSALVFVAYCISAVVLSRVMRPQRHARLFAMLAGVWSVAYLGSYATTPRQLWILPGGWTGDPQWLDAGAGLLALLLNVHSFVDFFYGFNGGFSTSLLLNLLRRHPQSVPTPELTDRYRDVAGHDKIVAWRLPALQRDGFVVVDAATGECSLTPRGRAVARLARFVKRVLNLGKGG